VKSPKPYIPMKSSQVTARKLFIAQGALHNYTKNPLGLQRCIEVSCIAMDAKEYERIKKDIDKELEDAKQRHEERLGALEIIWGLERGKQPPMDLLNSLTWADMARKVIPSLPEPFTRYDVENAVTAQFPGAKEKIRKNSLGGILTRMESRKEIEVVERGSGPRAAKYRVYKR
jgi:hypothetical protein